MRRVILFVILLIGLGSTAAYAQTMITGKVLDEKGLGFPSAGITVKGTTIGTVTDLDGNFNLSAPTGSTTLVIQGVGYRTQEVPIINGLITVRLQAGAKSLEETVVTANAIRREKRSLGYSTTQISGSEVTAGGSTSPLNALVGKAAGVNITTTSNSPGSSSRIVLRGGSSLGGNNQALIVIDGVPISNRNDRTSGNVGELSNQVDYGNRGNDINPEDIASVTVLKGPAATALYGSQGSNGAVMITTKRGTRRTGKTKSEVEVSSSYEISNILKYPSFQNEYGQGNIYEGIYDDRRENFSWGERFTGENRPWGQIIDGKQRVKPYSALEDNVKNFFDVGKTWNNNIAINGGNEQAAFRLGLNSLNSKSIYPGKKYDRYTISFNGNANLTNKLYASINFNYTKINSDLPGSGQQNASVIDNLYQTPRDIPITEGRDLNNPFNSMDYLDAAGNHRYGFYGAYANNPYYVLDQYKNTNNVDRLFGNAIIGYNITPWLKLENRLATDISSDRRYQSQPKYSSTAADESGLYDGTSHTDVGRYSEDIYANANLFNDLMLTGNKNISKDFSLNVLLGYNYSQYRLNNTFSSTNEEGGLIVPGTYFLSNSQGPALTESNISVIRKMGLYADISTGYKNMLFAGVSARNDFSSTINRSYLYYGANASFVFTELFKKNENFSRIFNYGKLRASYGSVGNDAGAYLDTTFYNRTINNGSFGSTLFPFGSVGGFSRSNTIGNSNIQPEYTQETEVGTELSFFNNRITADFSYYSKQSKNQIVTNPIAPASGYGFQVINAGLIVNRGVELALRLTPIITKDFRWEVYGTYTKNKNEVKEIYPGTDQITLGGFGGMSIIAAVGLPYGTFYTTGHEFTPDGRTIVDSASGLPTVSTTSQYYGSYNPDYQASWGTTLTYKGFSLNVLFDTKQGGVFYSKTRETMGFVGTSEETGNRDAQVWANSAYLGSDGQYHTNTTQYSPYTYFTASGIRPASEDLVNATYVKLREARLSYVLPKKWLDRTFIGSAALSIYGNNLFIWTPKSNKYVDPEVNSSGSGNAQGFDFSALPSQRNYGINLRLTF